MKFSVERKDRMKLYQHSARCPVAMQIFLDANPQYWRFVPMTVTEAGTLEQKTLPRPQVINELEAEVRSPEECRLCIEAVPRPPSGYVFSDRQILRQTEYFHKKRDQIRLKYNIDLYHATVVAVCKLSRGFHL